MIITRTPLRISFVGGGSDLEAYYVDHPGAVLSCTINKYVYVSVNEKFDGKIRVSYSRTENVNEVHELEHDIVRAALQYFDIGGGIEITSVSDIPGEGTGMGSSSAFTVGLVNALAAFKGQYLEAEELAQIACEIEIKQCGHIVGKQDQYASAYGGMNIFEFTRDGVKRHNIGLHVMTQSYLAEGFMLLYTGLTRRASTILADQHCRTADGSNTEILGQMVQQVYEMKGTFLGAGNEEDVARVLNRAWELKKQLTPDISTPEIDQLFQAARSQGASGGKLLGAGGGGFMLIWAHPKKHSDIAYHTGLRLFPFEFEFNGSEIVYQEN